MYDLRTRRGCLRARQWVEDAGQKWEEVRVVRNLKEYRTFAGKFVPYAISESEAEWWVFGSTGHLFVDRGKAIAYAPSCVYRAK